MQVTETESYNRWCPHIRCAIKHDRDDAAPATGNCDYGDRIPLGYASCIGSSCMMWRWDQRSKHDGGFPGSEAPTAAWKGYCGLAGKP